MNVLCCCGSLPCGPSRAAGSCHGHSVGSEEFRAGAEGAVCAVRTCPGHVPLGGAGTGGSPGTERASGQDRRKPDPPSPTPAPRNLAHLHSGPVPGQLRAPRLARAPPADVESVGSARPSRRGWQGARRTGDAACAGPGGLGVRTCRKPPCERVTPGIDCASCQPPCVQHS